MKKRRARNSTLPAPTKPMKRSPLRRKAKARGPTARTELYLDSQGIGFLEATSEVRRCYGPSRTWRVHRVRGEEGQKALEAFVTLHGYWSGCWLCGRDDLTHGAEIHHIASGGRKSDELTNFIYAGGELDCGCHYRVQSGRGDLLRECLLAKWRHDRTTLSWVRLIILIGYVPLFDSLGGQPT